jgi:hypothetical protein
MLIIDGVEIPRDVEAQGAAAIDAYVAAAKAVASTPETAPEGEE